jgi:hypothetical protein
MSSSKYHLFGDSHSWIINHKDIQKYEFVASSAMGLNNPKSISGSQKKFLNIYNKISKDDKIMLKFGQVDTEFVYYIKLSNNKIISYDEFAIDSINKYFKFILNNLDLKNIIILSIYPPFLNDIHVKKGITGLHFMDDNFQQKLIEKLNLINIPKINERVKFNKIYNNLLKEKCNELNIPFIDLETVLLNNNDESLYINSYANHHIQNKEGISKINNIITQFITNNNAN